MDLQHLTTLLETAGVDKDGDWSILKDERTMTLHVASNGVGLNVTRVRKVRPMGELVVAENSTGEEFVLHMEDIFAGSIAPESKSERKAGFR